ncbi:hypothetical protein QUF80_07040 [Desulfococcaceae bacterium HSG8]|nr:hypothetical protein [Desulfococcaceae bacterium HSG8]
MENRSTVKCKPINEGCHFFTHHVSQLMTHSLSKRIRRHVRSRMHDFFAVVSPGFESVCLEELGEIPPLKKGGEENPPIMKEKKQLPFPKGGRGFLPEFNIVTGGVEFKGRVHDCYAANLHLRTATRILMRIGEFRATSFSQLEKRLSDFPWELFLCPGAMPRISVTARHSRLYHSDAIAERFGKSISAREQLAVGSRQSAVGSWQSAVGSRQSAVGRKRSAVGRKRSAVGSRQEAVDRKQLAVGSRQSAESRDSSPQIFVRVSDDCFTVSLDSSGAPLYKRGIRKHTGKAPIRETIAASILKLAGYQKNEPLVDPLCGAGTFSLEAAMMASEISPGLFRKFAFEEWPVFSPRKWAYIRGEAEKARIRFSEPMIFASDKDRNACIRLDECVREYDLSGVISISCRDFFEFSPRMLTRQTGLVVLNPPYGRRIGTRHESVQIFHAICRHLKKEYKGWKIAMIVPDRQLAKTIPFKLTAHRFHHGGLKATLLVGRIKPGDQSLG